MNYPFGRNILLSTVGFDRLLSAFTDPDNAMSETKTTSYPPYNIIKADDYNYTIELAIAGFAKDEVEITVEDSKLTIAGKVNQNREVQYMHRGIAARDFTHEFTLAESVIVTGADMENGLLVIKLQNVVPEAAKPRRIEIGANHEPRLVDQKTAA
jgi:molecular chaperone IbpA